MFFVVSDNGLHHQKIPKLSDTGVETSNRKNDSINLRDLEV